ncbi:MAG: hypothetical protein K6G44_03965 [Lentisphaeria bacterium]|nr:hypothetical protein [Lentisphaeria bacterium]
MNTNEHEWTRILIKPQITQITQIASPQEPTIARRLDCKLRNSNEKEYQRLPAARRFVTLRGELKVLMFWMFWIHTNH